MLGTGSEGLHLAGKEHLSFMVASLIETALVDTLFDEAAAIVHLL